MTERLTERVGDGIRYFNGEYIITCYPKNNNLTTVDKLAAKLCEFEDKIENGTLIELPCKVGDTVYFSMETDGECEPYVFVGTVFAIGIDERHTMWISVRYEGGLNYYHTSDDFDKTVFLTKEEAEKGLAEKSQN